jgi:asparagine synthase (glutamine-hydrolysing)
MTSREGSLIVGVAGRPRIGDDKFDSTTVAHRILSLYRSDGERFAAQLRGPFALFVVDEEPRRVVLAVDRMGIESLSWGNDSNTLAFGSSSLEVARALSAPLRINHQALYGFMLSHVIAGPDTAFSGVRKVPAACMIVIDRGRASVRRYWNPELRGGDTIADVETLRKSVLPAIARGVAACEPEPHERTGSFLSGGLDSSTVTGLLARHTDRRSPAFSVGFGVEKFNELEFARLASAQFQCPHHEYEVTADDIVDAVPRIAAAYDEPFGNSSAVPTYYCAKFAKSHGVDHLLAGDGGDELFGGNDRYVRQRVFEHYRRVPAWLRTSIAEPLASCFDPESSTFVLRKFSSYVRQARVPLPERYESWNMIYNEGANNVFDAEFLATVDPEGPVLEMRATWDSCPSTDLLDRMHWYDWKYTLADNDLRKVTRMCELAGVRVSFPMIDEGVIDLSLRVPSQAKIAGNQLRAFYKSAVRGFLPEGIINKTKHGFGLPFGVWLKTHRPLQELVHDSLASLMNRGYLSRSFIERTLAEQRGGVADYYGSAIWDMLMLEQWLRGLEGRGASAVQAAATACAANAAR